MNFLGLTFLNTPFLVGLLAAAIPLLIHLSRSRRTKTIRFSTTRFLTDQFLRSYRMSRLKEWLLLLCRMALFALLAMALAQPFFRPRSATAATLLSTGSRCVVLVLDNSVSMGLMEDHTPLLDRAKTAARELLAGLRDGDSASIVLPVRRDDGPIVLFPQATTQLQDVRLAVDAIALSSAYGTDLRQAVKLADRIAAASAADSKEVYVLSDLQASGWDATEPEPNPESASVSHWFVRIRAVRPSHAAITAIQFAATRPMVGVPFAFRPQITVQGDRSAPLTVRLVIDDQAAGEKTATRLANGQFTMTRFTHTFTTPGWHSGYAEIDDPTLPGDNRRYFAVEVIDSISILAVNGSPSQVREQDELFFLQRALAPPGLRSSIRVDVVSPRELGGRLAGLAARGQRATKAGEQDVPEPALIVLANVEELPNEVLEKLEAYIDRGHGLLIFPGDRCSVARTNTAFLGSGRLHGGLFPARLTGLLGDPNGPESFAHIAEVDVVHPALTLFGDPKFPALTGPRAVQFKALWGLEPANDASVLMRANVHQSTPLLLERAYGRGRVLMTAFPCDRDWSNFPVRPVFLPWTYRLVSHLAQEPLGRQRFFTTGSEVPLPVSASEGLAQVTIEKPDQTIGVASYGSGDGSPQLSFPDTSLPGIYKIITAGRKENAALLAVNVENYESDLRGLDEVFLERDDSNRSDEEKIQAGLLQLMPGGTVTMVSYLPDESSLTDAIKLGGGVRLWTWLLWLVLLIALFEPWLANQISLKHYSKPKEPTVTLHEVSVAVAPRSAATEVLTS